MRKFSLLSGALAATLLPACTVTSTTTSDGGPPVDSGTPPPDGSSTPPDAESGTDGATSPLGFTPSNVDPGQLMLTGLGDIDISGSCVINTESKLLDCGSESLASFAVIAQPGHVSIGVYAAHSWHVEPGSTLTVQGQNALLLIALDTMTIEGALSATGAGLRPGGGGGVLHGQLNTQGAGAGGGGAGTATAAGGGGSYCGLGGGGATETGGSPSTGGAMYGTAGISPLIGGSSGGAGNVGDPGAGGGAIQLVAVTSINIASTASINVGGGGGNFGGLTTSQEASGGGSGGAVLLESPTVQVAGILAANGGGGGQGNEGDPGADATASSSPAPGGNKALVGSAGGNGSGGAATGGTGGADAAGQTAGGGGGGAGWIRINTRSGAATIAGTISPAIGACASQGTLKP